MLRRLRMYRVFGQTLGVTLLLGLLFAAAGSAAPTPPQTSPLSPILRELARPSVAAEPPAAQAEAVGVAPAGPASLLRDGRRILVTARFGSGASAAVPLLRQAGGRLVDTDQAGQTVTLEVAPADLEAIAAVPGVRAVWEQLQPVLYGAGGCEGGAVVSEGLGQLRVDQARETFDLRGKGLTVGVLSDSFDASAKAATHAQDDIASNDLPGPAGTCSEQKLPVHVLAEGTGSDEGRAMLQIVHDLAPHASLAFATAFQSEASFAQNIERLARPVSAGGAGAQVIVDDVAWFEEPFFQDGPVAAAINHVTAEGVSYLTATGNDNLFEGADEIASWEAPEFRDSSGCPAVVGAAHCMDFDPTAGTDRTFGITVEPASTLIVDLQWAEPWNGVLTNLDGYLLSESGSTVLREATKINSGPGGTQRPVELIQWANKSATAKTVQLAINRASGLAPRLKFILLENGHGVSSTEYPESSEGDVVGPSVFGHAGAAAAISVAAVPFDYSAAVEPYSSRGPVTHYFGAVEGTIPAAPLLPPEAVAKPDLAATDCAASTFFAFLSGGTWRFCGTSAAAPHAAAVAALVRQAGPGLSAQQVRDDLTATAVPVGAFPPQAAGSGLIDAFAALSGLPGPLAGGDGPDDVVAPTVAAEPGGPGPSGAIAAPPAPPQPSPPLTLILKHPPRIIRTHGARARVVFRFGADQPAVTFLCKVDAARFQGCGSRLARRFAPGPHVVKVKAIGSTGLADPTAAVFRFRVKRV